MCRGLPVKTHTASPFALRTPDRPARLVQMVQTVARRQILHASATIQTTGKSMIPNVISPLTHLTSSHHQFILLNLKALLQRNVSHTSGYPPPHPSAGPGRESRLASSVVTSLPVLSNQVQPNESNDLHGLNQLSKINPLQSVSFHLYLTYPIQ